MKQVDLIIQNKTGLHARPAKVLVNLAKQFKADITILHGEKKANAKSMVSILTLGATRGSRITVQVSGEDEEKALVELETAIQAGLGDVDEPAAPQPVSPPPVEIIKTPAPPAAPRVDGAIYGAAAAPGIAVGSVFHFQQVDIDLNNAAALAGRSLVNLREALDCAREQLTALCEQMPGRKMAAEAAIFEAHM
jgi:phosphocarrier protein FPr